MEPSEKPREYKEQGEQSLKEKRIRSNATVYYSRPDVQKEIYEFCKKRETTPRFFEGFGKRPDELQFPGDVFELVKKGATSFHCSEEIWEDPLKIETGMSEEKLNELREGWDLLIDIDCKYFDYSKKATQAIIRFLKKHGIENLGTKFSGSKGFHILVPWKSFPEEVGGEKTKNLFPELPRKIVSYIRQESEKEMKKMLPEDFESQFKDTELKKGIKCNNCGEIAEEILKRHFKCPKCHREETKKINKNSPEAEKDYKCPDCRVPFEIDEFNSKTIYECKRCGIDSEQQPNNFSRHIETDIFELMGLDLVLVAPRHLFRTPYSLHEKTSLASIVIESTEKSVENFDMKDASPFKVEVRPFQPEPSENEASQLVREAIDWYEQNKPKDDKDEKPQGKYADFKPVQLKEILDKNFPPAIQTILKGVYDGRKRALFVLINFFRSIGMEKENMEKRIYEWNEKNSQPLKQGYVKSQLSWSYRHKPLLPPNYDKDYYNGIGVVPTEEERRYKNPVNYTVKKSLQTEKTKKSSKKPKTSKENKRNKQ